MSDALSLPRSGLIGIDGRPIATVDDDTPHWLTQEQDDKDFTFNALGDLSDIDVFYGWVLVVKFIRRVVAKGVMAAAETQNEDTWQGKVGLVVKKGPAAFQSDKNNEFSGANPKVGDWVIFRSSDGWDCDLGNRSTRFAPYLKGRFIQDAHIIGTTKYPGRLF